MGLFNDIGKFLGGIASAVVPGFSTIAKTGVFGNDLAALNGAPGVTTPQASVIASSPALTANTLSAPAVTPTRPPPSYSPAYAPPTAPGVRLSGRVVQMPIEYAIALRQAASGASGGASIVPGAPVTPLQQTMRAVPLLPQQMTPASPGFVGASSPGWPGISL